MVTYNPVVRRPVDGTDRRRPMSRGKYLGWLAVVVLVVAACGEEVQPDVTPAPEAPVETTAPAPEGPEGTLTLALTTEPNSIYTPNTAERNANNVAAQMFEGPVWIDDDGLIQPALATSWEVNDDGSEFIFTPKS